VVQSGEGDGGRTHPVKCQSAAQQLLKHMSGGGGQSNKMSGCQLQECISLIDTDRLPSSRATM